MKQFIAQYIEDKKEKRRMRTKSKRKTSIFTKWTCSAGILSGVNSALSFHTVPAEQV